MSDFFFDLELHSNGTGEGWYVSQNWNRPPSTERATDVGSVRPQGGPGAKYQPRRLAFGLNRSRSRRGRRDRGDGRRFLLTTARVKVKDSDGGDESQDEDIGSVQQRLGCNSSIPRVILLVFFGSHRWGCWQIQCSKFGTGDMGENAPAYHKEAV